MPSLAKLPSVVGFFSYSHTDAESWRLFELKDSIQRELSYALGRTLKLWDYRDVNATEDDLAAIKAALRETVFYIPFITDSVLADGYRQFEYREFLARQNELRRKDLIFPLLSDLRIQRLVPSMLEDPLWKDLGARINKQMWRVDPDSADYKNDVQWFCTYIAKALKRPVRSRIERSEFAEQEQLTTAKQERSVFISYRREERAADAGRIYDRLKRELGADQVFMDVDTTPLGVNFIDFLRDEVAKCHMLLAVMGPKWLDAANESGIRRLDDPTDFVRIEIATALKRGIRVVPVLLDGAILPKVHELPEDLKELPLRNALSVNHGSFHADLDRLIRELGVEPGLTKPEDKRL